MSNIFSNTSHIPGSVTVDITDRQARYLGRTEGVLRIQKTPASYTAVFRLAQAAARLDQSFTQIANTNKQWATIHHTSASTKELRLLKCGVFITAWSIATQGVLELRELSAAPATGNPVITPRHHRKGFPTAAEAVCLYLPTTGGTEAAVDGPLGSIPFDLGAMAVGSTINPLVHREPLILYDASQEDDMELPLTVGVGVLGGWAVVLRTVGAPVVRITVVMRFTEEIPQ